MNTLFPIFVKLDQIQTLLVGGGNVGLEKLAALLKNSPHANVKVVATYFLDECLELAQNAPNVQVFQRKFEITDLENIDLIILATDDRTLHENIKIEAQKRHILTNVADTPPLCDFYLGSVVQKGDLKIGISTNGKSPTLAKRLRELFEEIFPDQIQELLDNLQSYRNTLKGNFEEKIKALNDLTVGKLK